MLFLFSKKPKVMFCRNHYINTENTTRKQVSGFFTRFCNLNIVYFVIQWPFGNRIQWWTCWARAAINHVKIVSFQNYNLLWFSLKQRPILSKMWTNYTIFISYYAEVVLIKISIMRDCTSNSSIIYQIL